MDSLTDGRCTQMAHSHISHPKLSPKMPISQVLFDSYGRRCLTLPHFCQYNPIDYKSDSTNVTQVWHNV